MDKHIIKMPDIGEGIAEVEIVEWHVAPGDNVAEDQVLADVMTDKASVEIPSPIAGTVVSLGGQVGDILAVGSDLIVLQPQGSVSAGTRAEPTSRSAAVSEGATVSETVPSAATASDAAAEPDVKPRSDSDTTAAAGPGTARAADERPHTRPASKVLASPSVRHRARQLDIDLLELADVVGDNPVSHRDLDEYLLSRLSRQGVSAQTESAPVRASRSEPTMDDMMVRGDTQIKVIGLRRQIAQKMLQAKQQIPHFSYVEEVDVTELDKLRQTLNAELESDQDRLTLLPFLVRAIVLAVQRHPEVNAHYDGENGVVTQFGAVHMGVATQTDQGLMVPVVHDVQSMDIWECASGIRRVTSLTRRGKASRRELSGSTITLTSLGALGGIVSTPIINHPEVAIVGVNRIVERLVMNNGQVVPRKFMNLSSSFDHRIVDGMNAAQFIQEVRRHLETPALLFVRGTP